MCQSIEAGEAGRVGGRSCGLDGGDGLVIVSISIVVSLSLSLLLLSLSLELELELLEESLSDSFIVNIIIKGCVEMDIPWHLCRTIGPLLSQRFLLASAKAQPRGGGCHYPFTDLI